MEFAIGLQNAFVGIDDIAARREAGHETCVRNGDEAFHAFATEEAFQDVHGKVVAVRDGHDGHVVF